MAAKKKKPAPKAPESATADALPARAEEGYPVEDAARWEHLRDLAPWKRNPRFIGEADVEEAVASFLRFGFGAPMLVWREPGMLVAGHARRLGVLRLLSGKALAPVDKDGGAAAHRTGAERPDLYTYEVDDKGRIAAGTFRFAGAPGPGFVPVRRMSFANEDEAMAYALRDNNPIGEEDEEAVAALRAELEGRGVETGDLGFDEAADEALRAALGDEGGDDEGDGGLPISGDDASAPKEVPSIRFELFKLLITKEEADQFREKLRAYIHEHGSEHGFGRRIVDRV